MKKTITVLVTICLVFIIIISIIPLFINANYLTDYNKKFDVIIVLGNPAKDNCLPGKTMAKRVEKGVELYKKGYANKIIFTGNAVANKCTEAKVMAKYAKNLGTPDSVIIIEPKARSTIENAKYSTELMRQKKFNSALIVTSKFHIKRSSLIFSKYKIYYKMVASKSPEKVPILQKISWFYRENLIIVFMLLS